MANLRKIRKKHNKNVKKGRRKTNEKEGSYFSNPGADPRGTDAEQVGAGIATVLVMPHLAITGFAVLFNALGAFMYNRAFVLVAGILYAVAILLFPVYFMFVVVQAVLCFIAFAIMQKKQPNN